MPNHVHLILKPRHADDLRRAVGETHRRSTNFINARGRWPGHLFQSRFASVVLDDTHLIRAVRYVSMNRVRIGLVARPEDWMWSSVRAHLSGFDDLLVTVRPVLDRIPHLKQLLRVETDDDFTDLRRAEATGRVLGAPSSSPALRACWAAKSLAALQAANQQPKTAVQNSWYCCE